MPIQRFDVDVPDGHRLGYSRDTDGARRALIFRNDTNELAGHAELFEVEHEWSLATPNRSDDRFNSAARGAEPNPELVACVEASFDAFFRWLTPYAEAAAARAGDRLRNWWLDTALPACKSTAQTTWTRATDWRKADPHAEPPGVATVPPDWPAKSSHEDRARRMAALLEANPSLLEEFVKVFPRVDAANGQPTISAEQEERPPLRLVAS